MAGRGRIPDELQGRSRCIAARCNWAGGLHCGAAAGLFSLGKAGPTPPGSTRAWKARTARPCIGHATDLARMTAPLKSHVQYLFFVNGACGGCRRSRGKRRHHPWLGTGADPRRRRFRPRGRPDAATRLAATAAFENLHGLASQRPAGRNCRNDGAGPSARCGGPRPATSKPATSPARGAQDPRRVAAVAAAAAYACTSPCRSA